MEREIILAMRLVGATRVEELVPEMVCRLFIMQVCCNLTMVVPFTGRASLMAALSCQALGQGSYIFAEDIWFLHRRC